MLSDNRGKALSLELESGNWNKKTLIMEEDAAKCDLFRWELTCYQGSSVDTQNTLSFNNLNPEGRRCRFIFIFGGRGWGMITLNWSLHSFVLRTGVTLLKRCFCSEGNKTNWLGENTKLPKWNEDSCNSDLTLSVHTPRDGRIVSDEFSVFLFPALCDWLFKLFASFSWSSFCSRWVILFINA